MNSRIFNRETLLDLVVNMIPIVIMLIFLVLFALYNPWPGNAFMSGLGLALVIVPLILLAILTYLAADAIEA